MVYSTCSLNPVENEAVVSAALDQMSTFQNPIHLPFSLSPILPLGNVRIIPTTDLLPGLKRRPGKTTWKVLSKNLEELTPPEEGAPFKLGYLIPGKEQKLPRSLWPNGKEAERGIEQW
jgi:multisite-specific tRNA:(cytosine-C5)-methyltransferase